VASNKSGATYVELIFSFLIFSVLLIPVGMGVELLYSPKTESNESFFLTKIRNQISLASSESLNYFKETKIVYNKGDEVNGFIFKDKLKLEFTLYGQLKSGESVRLFKGTQKYRLYIRPITGFIRLERE